MIILVIVCGTNSQNMHYVVKSQKVVRARTFTKWY